MVTVWPIAPLVGNRPVMVGPTTKFAEEVAVSPFAVTVTGPVVAPVGTVVTISVVVALMTTATVPLNETALLAAVGSKLDPAMVTAVPADPLDGVTLVMEGPDVPQLDSAANARTIVALMNSFRNGTMEPLPLSRLLYFSNLKHSLVYYKNTAVLQASQVAVGTEKSHRKRHTVVQV
jgi:hypothetical protein